MKKIFYCLSVFFLTFLFIGCEEENSEELGPTACFEIPDSVFVGLPAEFSAACSEEAENYAWSFGDGSSGSDSIVSHTFSEAGDYEITLIVTNENGTDELTKKLEVFGNKVVHVNSHINSNTTWKKDSVYLIEGDVRVNAVLTIEAGTVVKFTEGKYISCDDGRILARGTEQLPIIFTSIRDDSYGGDSNSDGNGTSPAKGDWDFIAIGGTNNASEFDYCKFLYGGGYSAYMDYTLFLESSTTSVTNCTFAYNIGLEKGTLCAEDAEDVTIAGNVFYNNDIPLSISGKFDIDNSNIFHNPEDHSEKNTHNGIYVLGTYEGIAGNRTWGETKVPMVIRGGSSDLRIKSGNSLTLAPGVTVKMGEGIGIYASEGILLAEGTASQPVVFTSIHDDSRGGDTDGNGNTIDPMPGDWDDLRVSGTNNNTKFKYCEFYYGGGYSDYQDYTLLVKTNNTIIDHCTFAYNLGESLGAVNLEDASNGTKITNNIFYSNIKPLFISGKIEVDNTNVFHNPSEPSEINTKNGVFVNDNRIKGNINWSLTEVPFVMIVDIAVEAGNSLTLAENVTLKFDNGIALRYPGTNIVNYDSPGVYFTSYKDDEKVGDTNGDGSTSSPASGDWTGIYNSNSREYEAWPNIFYSEH